MMKKFLPIGQCFCYLKLTWIGLQDPQIKEILRLKSFDLLFQSQDKEVSEDIAIVTIDEKFKQVYMEKRCKRCNRRI